MCLPTNSIILLHSPIIHPRHYFYCLTTKRADRITRPPAAAAKAEPLPPVLSLPSFCSSSYVSFPNPANRSTAKNKQRKKMEVEAPRQRSNTSPSSSPEFEFWMVRNPSFPPSNLLTADELFLDGVVLPLQLLSLPNSGRPAQPPSPLTAGPPAEPSPSPSSILFSSSSTSSSLSRRWKDLFKVAPEKKPGEKDQEKNLRKKDRKSSADLNINLNIWPFTRSQSAGGRPRSIGSVSGRKVSSAPCSRSNSRGESGSGGRRWAASPGRGGVHLGRSSPVWQIRRAGTVPKEKGRMWTQASVGGGVGAGVRVLNLNVNSCIGYSEKVSSRGDDSDVITGGERIVERSGANGSVTSAFSLRALFSSRRRLTD